MISVGNIRELIGHLIGKRLLDISQQDPEQLETDDPFIQLMFEDGNTLTFFVLESELYKKGCMCFSDPHPGRIDDEDMYTPTEEEKAGGKWAVIEMNDREPVEGHVVPTYGRNHFLHQQCWCGPKSEMNPHGMLCVTHEAQE
jgi:hypothetical protein